MFSTGMRLALPMVAILLLVDISLALLGRVNAQLQLLTIAFPVKMLVGLAIFGWLLLLMPVFLRTGSESAFAVSRSRTRNPTISFSVSSLGTATYCTQVSLRATLRTQSTSAALVTLR